MFLNTSTNVILKIKQKLALMIAMLLMLSQVSVYAQDSIKEVEIDYKGQIITMKTQVNTVKDVLKESGIVLLENDEIVPSLDTSLDSAKTIKITGEKFQEIMKTVQSSVDFETEKIPNDKMSKGKEKIVTKGKKGTVEKTYFAVYYKEEKLSTTYLGMEVLEEPTKEVIEYGTANPTTITSRGYYQRNSEGYEMISTAYTAGPESTGKRPGDRGYGVTASGMYVAEGVVAVDPSIIPLGTKLYIEGLNGETLPNGGYAIAADTGGAIKGNKIDIYMETVPECTNWGRRKVKVYILE